MIRRIKHITIAAAVIPLLAGCSVNDPIHETNHPTTGKITVTADWCGIDGGAAKPAAWTVAVGNHSSETSTDKYAVPAMFEPGGYDIILYNKVAEIPVTDGIAALQTVSAPQGEQGTYVNPMPGWLFSGAVQATIQKDTDHEFTVPMRQEVRQLALIVKPTGGTTDRITNIEATLTGVAGAWDIAANKPSGNPASVAFDFTEITEGDNTGSWSATVRLIGIVGDVQTLSGTVKFKEDTPQPVTLNSDLSAGLAGFNRDKHNPLTLGGTVADTPTGGGFGSITIDGWAVVEGPTQEAN